MASANATLAGLENAITAMTDDILGAYAAAQVMVARSTSNTEGGIEVLALRFGSNTYIYAIAEINGMIVLLVLAVGFWTRG